MSSTAWYHWEFRPPGSKLPATLLPRQPCSKKQHYRLRRKQPQTTEEAPPLQAFSSSEWSFPVSETLSFPPLVLAPHRGLNSIESTLSSSNKNINFWLKSKASCRQR